ncbi:MAG: iron-sulfur cluster assembly scaffold protein [Alphaproteobacteria bacterium]|nr:iron-sulfur cluster assembly scaffold protein [Alphaproteobacteria bacterium]
MRGEQDLVKLYSGRILALAASIPLTDRLATPQATSRKRAPLCGSTVTVDLVIDDGRIVEFGQDVKACALGQAAASVIAANAIGRTLDELCAAKAQLYAMLKGTGPVPSAPFDQLEVLLPAQNYKNRHASIMLSIEAAVAAFEMATDTACV